MRKGKRTKIWHKELSNHQNFTCGKDCVIHSHTWIGNNVEIGDRVKIEAMTFIPDGVVILDDVFIGPGVIFTNDPKLTIKGKEYWKKTYISEGVKIGANATIIAGNHIGAGAIIGAGAVVTKNVPKGEIWVGNPAHKLNKSLWDHVKSAISIIRKAQLRLS